MKNFNKIVMAMATILLGIGTLCCVIGGIKGGFRNANNINFNFPFASFRFDYDNGKKGFDSSVKDFVIKDGEEADFEASEIKDLDLDIGGCQCRLEESEDGRIHVKSTGNLKLAAKAEGGTLHIKTENGQTVSNDKKVIIAMPKDMVFDEIDVSLGAIEMFTEIPLVCDTFDLDAGAGSIKIKELTAKVMDIDAGAGEISIAQGFTEDLDLDMGMGSFEYSGDITGDFDLDMSMGSALLELGSSEKDHNYDISCAGGSAAVGSHRFDGFGKSSNIDNGVDSDFDIDCSMGSVNITFADKL